MKKAQHPRITFLERLVWSYVARAYTNDDIQGILRSKHKIAVTATTVRNAIRRLLMKLGIPDELDSAGSYKKRVAERVLLAKRFWDNQLPQSKGLGAVSTNEEDFYELASQLFRTVRKERIIGATKTPVLLLSNEVDTPGRSVYYDDFLASAESRNAQIQYLVSLPKTLDQMNRIKRGTEKARLQMEHFRRATTLERAGLVEIRSVVESQFNSCILGPRYGAVLHKDPVLDRVIFVERVEGQRLALYTRYFEEVLSNAQLLDQQRLVAIEKQQQWSPQL